MGDYRKKSRHHYTKKRDESTLKYYTTKISKAANMRDAIKDLSRESHFILNINNDRNRWIAESVASLYNEDI